MIHNITPYTEADYKIKEIIDAVNYLIKEINKLHGEINKVNRKVDNLISTIQEKEKEEIIDGQEKIKYTRKWGK